MVRSTQSHGESVDSGILSQGGLFIVSRLIVLVVRRVQEGAGCGVDSEGPERDGGWTVLGRVLRGGGKEGGRGGSFQEDLLYMELFHRTGAQVRTLTAI